MGDVGPPGDLFKHGLFREFRGYLDIMYCGFQWVQLVSVWLLGIRLV